jgi:hypothetical protein
MKTPKALAIMIAAYTLTVTAAVAPAAAESKPCLVIKNHVKHGSEALMRWTEPKPYDYVEGDFPKGMKFQSEIGDKQIRQIQGSGGKVVIVKPNYTLEELKSARTSCSGDGNPQP